MSSPFVSAPPGNTWVAQHHAQLLQHVEQCAVRRGALPAAQVLSALHAAVSRRFLTTVCTVAAVMLVPLLFG